MVEFLSLLGDIEVSYNKGDKIIIDETNGTIITGKDITIEPITISYGDITIHIENSAVSVGDSANPAPKISEKTPTIASLVSALQRIGTTSQNIIAILNAMKKSGAINVSIESI